MIALRGAARGALLGGALLLGGCVYYNGMYNTNRLAKSARKAERDGRPFEAQGFWGQVITRADSLVIRHPQSKYADQASVLRGLALARLNQCPEAVGPLGRLSLVHLSTDFTEEAALALGRCQLQLGDPGLADLAFVRVLNSADSARRREARFRHARALRMNGQYEEALTLMRESPDPRDHEDVLLALAGTGRTEEALVFADSVLALNDTTFAWDSVVTTIGRRDVRAGSALVGRLGGDPHATPEVRARRLYDDGVRLAEVDSAAAHARFQQAAQLPGPTDAGERARLRLIRASLSASRSLDELSRRSDSLAPLTAQATSPGLEAAALQIQVAELKRLDDSARADVPLGDLRLFLGAEAARDSLRAPVLAAAMFRRLADEWPSSPYAPKALLAAQQLDPVDPDGTRARLDSLYHDSPYLAVVRGEEAPGYRHLEDSLETFAAAQPVLTPRRGGGVERARGAPGAARPGQGIPAEDLVRPRRPVPPAGQQPLPEDTPRPRRRTAPPGEDTPAPRHGVEP
ncbi:MAG: tetratricopeptide repeat protein [Gemmatimonadales bacterium]